MWYHGLRRSWVTGRPRSVIHWHPRLLHCYLNFIQTCSHREAYYKYVYVWNFVRNSVLIVHLYNLYDLLQAPGSLNSTKIRENSVCKNFASLDIWSFLVLSMFLLLLLVLLKTLENSALAMIAVSQRLWLTNDCTMQSWHCEMPGA